MQIKSRSYFHDALLFISAVALYAPSLRYGFVGDDLIYFIGNQHIESFDVMTILSSGAIGADYLPLRDLSFALDYYIWGADPFGFHLTSVVLYGMTAIGVRHLFFSMHELAVGQHGVGVDTQATLVSMLLVLHPTHRDVVCAVYNRGALLTVLFCILACVSFIRYLRGNGGKHMSYAAALLCYICALMSREYGIVLPLLLVMLAFFGDRPKRQGPLISTVPFFLAAAIFFVTYKKFAVAANYIQPSTDSFISDVISKLSVAVKIAAFYIVRMVTFAGKFSQAEGVMYVLASAAAISGLLYGSIVLRRRHPHLLMGFLFYLIGLLPVLNFFKTYPIIAARYSYLPTLGLFFAMMAIPFQGWKKLVFPLSIVFLLLWSGLTMRELRYYENNITYWENVVPYAQEPEAYMQLGFAYYANKRYAQALDALVKVQPAPMDAKYHTAVGISCLQLGDYKCAVDSLRTAQNLGASDPSIAQALSKAYLALGNVDK